MRKWLCGFLAVCVLLSPLSSYAEGETPAGVSDGSQSVSSDGANGADDDAGSNGAGDDAGANGAGDDAGSNGAADAGSGGDGAPAEEGGEQTPPTIDWEAIWKTEAWLYEADGSVFSGSLSDLCKALLVRDEENGVTETYDVVLCKEDAVLLIKEIKRSEIDRFEFFMDDRVIKDAKNKTIMVSEINPQETPEEKDRTNPDEIVNYYVWIEAVVKPTPDDPTPTPDDPTPTPDDPTPTPDDPTPTPVDPTPTPDDPTPTPDNSTATPVDPTPAPPVAVELTVDAQNHVDSAWNNVSPTFVLSGIPEGQSYWTYGVVVYGKRILVLDGDTYTPTEEGEYTLRFVMLDDLGDVAVASEIYTLMLDLTPPEIAYVNTQTGVSYQMEVTAMDALSGMAAISIDGGATWTDCDPETPFQWTASGSTTIAAGMIRARDVAGNITEYPEEVQLVKASSGGGGGGGGGGADPTYQPHSSGKGEEAHGYDQVKVEEEGAAMHVLTLDGEELELTLLLDEAKDFEFDETYEPLFTVKTGLWPSLPSEDETDVVSPEEQEPDTLILEGQIDEQIEGDYAYRWQIGGAVLRQLNKSGVKYLVLRVGDYVTTLPTEGFLAGEKYTELKMQGISTRRFLFDVVISNTLQPADPEAEHDTEPLYEVSVTVSVEEDVTVLTEDESQPMYMFDVYAGPPELLDVPYGTWIPEENMDSAV